MVQRLRINLKLMPDFSHILLLWYRGHYRIIAPLLFLAASVRYVRLKRM